MTVLSLPASMVPVRQRWQEEWKNIEMRSVFGSQILQPVPPVWATELEFDDRAEWLSGDIKALQMQLAGGNQLEAHYMGRPVPLGTMRGTLTLAADVAQGAGSLTIDGGAWQAGKTLLAGDFLGLGSGINQQVVMVVEDAVSDEAGKIVVGVEHPLRNAFPAGTPVIWDKPKALFRLRQNRPAWEQERARVKGLKLDLIESVYA